MQTETVSATGDRLLRAREAAERLAVAERTVWSLASRGLLPPVRLGAKATRFRESDVVRLVVEGVAR